MSDLFDNVKAVGAAVTTLSRYFELRAKVYNFPNKFNGFEIGRVSPSLLKKFPASICSTRLSYENKLIYITKKTGIGMLKYILASDVDPCCGELIIINETETSKCNKYEHGAIKITFLTILELQHYIFKENDDDDCRPNVVAVYDDKAVANRDELLHIRRYGPSIRLTDPVSIYLGCDVGDIIMFERPGAQLYMRRVE